MPAEYQDKLTRELKPQADKRLRETMRRLELQKQALDQFAIVTETDAEGRITYVNDQFCKISKYSREELMGKDHRDVVHSGYHSKEFWREMWETISGGKIWRADVKNRAKDGTTFWLDTTIVPLMGSDGKPEKYFALRIVVSDRKQMEEILRIANEQLGKQTGALKAQRQAALNIAQDLKEAKDKAEQLSRLKDEFVANVSHEFRTPLTAIQEAASLIRDGILGSINKDQCEFLSIINESVDRLAALINNMLDLAKIEAGRLELKRRKAAVRDLIETTLKSCQPIVGNRTLEWDSIKVPDVFADRDKTLQVLGNFLSNAIKFTKEDGVITFQAEERDGEVSISVEDNGTGIAKEDLSKLFQKFSQVGNGINRRRGTGLGLALCKEIVEAHKGTVSVTSEPGKGSKFAFTLPVYTSKFALEESFSEQLELVKQFREGGFVGVIAIEGDILKNRLDEVQELLHKNLHHSDSILTVEPHWVVILAATEAAGGVEAIVKRLPAILEKLTPSSFHFGTALYPKDGADIHSVFEKAKRALHPLLLRGMPK